MVSAIQIFDALAPRDRGVEMRAGISYGPGPRQRLDAYGPRARGTPLPVVLFFHGGGWNTGSRHGYGFAGCALAARGFLALVPDYGLHPDEPWPQALRDGAKAIAFAHGEASALGGDPRRIVLAGHSTGAHIAAMLALDPQWCEAEGIAPGVVTAFAGLAGPYDFLPLADPATIRAFSHVEDLAATQPVNFVQAGSPPAFLATGAADRSVAPRHTRDFGEGFRAVGVPAETRFYDGIGHAGILLALARPLRWRAPVLDEMAGFLMRHAAG